MNVGIRDIPNQERPRERFLTFGPSVLSNEELLSILLKTGSKEKSVKVLALELLKEIHALGSLKDQSISSLTKIKGIGLVKATELLACVELGKRIFLEEEKALDIYRSAYDIWRRTRYLFEDKKQEYFYCFYFNTKQELVERKLLFMGTVNRSVVHPREVFKEAYLSSASSIICVHNHPSNDVTPSKEDIRVTEALMKVGELNGIPVVDHLIVGRSGYYSFYEKKKFFI